MKNGQLNIGLPMERDHFNELVNGLLNKQLGLHACYLAQFLPSK